MNETGCGTLSKMTEPSVAKVMTKPLLLDDPVFSPCGVFKDHVELGTFFENLGLEKIFADLFLAQK